MMKECVRVYGAEPLSEGKDYGEFLQNDFTISCDSQGHKRLVVLASVIFLILPLGFPLGLFYMLWSKNPWTPSTEDTAGATFCETNGKYYTVREDAAFYEFLFISCASRLARPLLFVACPAVDAGRAGVF